MPLEAVMICIDNSDYMRNSDYIPSRIEAQNDAVSYVSSAKLNSNAETTVGLISMAGQRIEVHTSPSRSIGQIMTSLVKNLKIYGKCNIVGALKTAQLALKNRVNKNQRQRIILFIGSPVDSNISELERIGKQLKKNNVAVDIVNFGSENTINDNAEKLEALISSVNSSDNSHLVNIPPGPHVLSDMVGSSPIIVDGGSGIAVNGSSSAAGASGQLNEFGIDEEADPEMAMALRMSLEEERARQGGSTDTTATGTATATQLQQSGVTTAQSESTGSALASTEGDADMNDEEAMLAQAIALSMQADNEQDNNNNTTTTTATTSDTTMTDASNNLANPAVSADSTQQTSNHTVSEADTNAALDDPDFINSLLSSVPGVNQSDLNVNNLLDELNKKSNQDNKDQQKDNNDNNNKNQDKK